MPTGTGLESLNCGAFRAWFTAYTDNPQANYAMPVAPTEPAAFGAEVEALRTLFGSRVRKLRVEFVEELWPGLAPALQRSGLHLQAREPLMACTRSEFTPVVAPGVSVRLLGAGGSDSELAAYLHIADERPADGSRPVPDKAVARLRQMLSSGNETCAIGTIDARARGGRTVDRAGRWPGRNHVDRDVAGVSTARRGGDARERVAARSVRQRPQYRLAQRRQ
jgi:hypothetical protein